MNPILQKRIEAESNKYMEEAIEMNSMVGDNLHYEDLKTCFIEAADFALQNQWISVEEALPDKGHEVLVAILNTKINTYFYGFDAIVDDSVFLRDKNGFTIDVDYHKITHWMPIPSLKGGEE